MHRTVLAVSVVFVGCGSSTAPPRPTAVQDSSMSDQTPSPATTPVADVLVTADAARAANLPALTIRGRVPSGLHPSSTPSGDTWFSVSGPPGGPLGVQIRTGVLDADALRIDRASDGFGDGATGAVDINGVRWSVATWIEGQSLGRSAHFAMWRRVGATVVVVDAYWGADAAPAATLADLDSTLRTFVDTLAITP